MENNDFKVVDTSTGEHNAQFANMDLSDNFFGDEDDAPEQDDQEYTDETTDSGYDAPDTTQPEGTGNEHLDAYISWADSMGVEVDPNSVDPKTFDADEMDRQVGKHYVQKYLGNVDPRIVQMAEAGIDMDTYMENRANISRIINTDPVQLFKSQMYEHIKSSEASLGTIQLDDNGNPTTEQYGKYLYDEVERRAAGMAKETMEARGKQLQEHYREQMDKLPDELIQQQQAKYESGLSQYNNEVKQLTDAYAKSLSKADNLIVDFSGQAEKDDYIRYMRKNLEIQEIDGQKVVPLLHKLQNDEKFLANTMRLLHMHESGYFTDLKNSERNAAFKKLSVVPVIGKGKSATGGNSGKGGFVDTSHPDYQKQFLKR